MTCLISPEEKNIMKEQPIAWGSHDSEPLNRQKLGFLIASGVRFVGEGLAEILQRAEWIKVLGTSSSAPEAISRSLIEQPDFVLLDAGLDNGLEAVAQYHRVLPHVRIVAFAVAETEQSILSWAEAGAVGYILRGAALADLLQTLSDISNGRQCCPSSVTFGTLRRLAHLDGAKGRGNNDRITVPLTGREMEISALIGAGLSNKEIARRLNIGVSTTKSHVHNLLAKLNVQRRGQIAASALGYVYPYDRNSRSVERPISRTSNVEVVTIDEAGRVSGEQRGPTRPASRSGASWSVGRAAASGLRVL
jgi:DNA-binding NarL/FixJ family response regulator